MSFRVTGGDASPTLRRAFAVPPRERRPVILGGTERGARRTSFRFTLSTADDSAVESMLTDLVGTDGVIRVAATLQTHATLEPGGPVRWNG